MEINAQGILLDGNSIQSENLTAFKMLMLKKIKQKGLDWFKDLSVSGLNDKRNALLKRVLLDVHAIHPEHIVLINYGYVFGPGPSHREFGTVTVSIHQLIQNTRGKPFNARARWPVDDILSFSILPETVELSVKTLDFKCEYVGEMAQFYFDESSPLLTAPLHLDLTGLL